MSVTFVIGRAGSGKTARCFGAIVEALRADPLGTPIYWLVPRQATFQAERELTCSSGLPAFSRARIVSFDDFGRDVFDACGGSSIPQVTSLGRQMILGHLLRRHGSRLRFFQGVAHQPGLAAELDATFGEIERCGKTCDDISALLGELAESNAADLELAPLRDKLHDLHLLYDAYCNYLGQDRLDQHRRLTQVQASLSHCTFLKRCTIYVDGFAEFTEYERRILAGAAKAGATMEIMLLLDPDSPVIKNPHLRSEELSLFYRTEESYRRLYFAFSQENVALDEPVLLTEAPQRFRRPSLSHLERHLFSDPIIPSPEAEGIELIEAPGRRAEVDAVARRIRQLLAGGLRMRDIVVLARDLEPYHALIDASFREHNLNWFADRRRSASHHPLVQFVRHALNVALHDWPHDHAIGLLKTGLAAVSAYDADGIENYVLRHRIRGSAGWERTERWGFKRDLLRAEDEPSVAPPEDFDTTRHVLVDRLSPFVEKLRPAQPLTVRQYATEVFALFDWFDVRGELLKWIAASAATGDLEQAGEHEQVWAKLVELFEQMVELLGEEPLSGEAFLNVLESGLEELDLALTPPTVDQVLVGEVLRSRTPPARAVFVLGLNEGEFPFVPRDGSVLSDRDRRALKERKLELEPDLRRRLLDERMVGYVAFTRGSERLIVSRPMADDEGRPAEPSVFWHRLQATFPDVKVTRVPPERSGDPQQIATPRQLVTSLMRWVRVSCGTAAPGCVRPQVEDSVSGGTQPRAAVPHAQQHSIWRGLYHWLATAECDSGPIDLVRYRAWRALSYANEAALSDEWAKELFAAPLRATATQIETFAACPFRHFMKFGLALRERDSADVTPRDLGRVYHELMEKALAEVLKRRAAGEKGVKLEETIERYVEQVGRAVRDELILGSARNRYLLDRTRRVLQLFARSQREMLARGSFRPAHVGVTFGDDSNLPALRITTPSGSEILLSGKIDRVDQTDGGDVAVIDYRPGKAMLPPGMVFHGLSLQLLTHLLVLEEAGQPLSRRPLVAAAALYLQLVRRIEDVKHPEEGGDPSDPKWLLKLKPRGLLDLRCLPAFDKSLTTGASEVVQVFINKDGTLGRRNYSDGAATEDFRALLDLARRRLSEIGDAILSGRIDIAPYRLKDKSPCPRCEFRGVCRFEPSINRYRILDSIDRDTALGARPEEVGGAA